MSPKKNMATRRDMAKGIETARFLLLAGCISTTLALCAREADAAETVLDGLDYPWDIETHDGAIYIIEKAGTLGILDDGTFTRMPIETSATILNDRGGGLLGLALRPDFAETGRVVLYHHTGTAERRSNRVVEVELRDGTWHEIRVLLDGIPGHPLYNGGRVAFGPDGMLYITTGWTEDRQFPQEPDSLAGKILRLTPDGAIPADNPFPGSPVWSLGHRNPQGIAWDGSGQLFAAEHGQSGHDEVNRIERRANYGWPVIEGNETRDGMVPPFAHSGGDTWAPSGLAWDGERMLLAGLRAEGVLSVDAAGNVSLAMQVGERIRDVLVMGDEVYAITTNRSPRQDGVSRDRLIRLMP
ncbi:PQQ-dependent sugar dehydrogenase [Paracoccus sp. MBLB3053]|uniref:PQQ-dependent sugar dehydrogenase n=1 Tax=Paracoccus aurantius TaxID=3073814 RepID=A0ABU2HR18_9RHOB|nr:PQQ-dependent sugar dehydrogenase [Paracoccus sp. MBLB3053]MDS9467483.1 PQQ-dependent sugar dehydrogenase [Paracoccus sp. MBLB3053]